MVEDPQQNDFLGDETLPNEIHILETPLQFFKYLFDENIVNMIVEETNIFSRQKDVERGKMVNSTQILDYLGICIMSSVHRVNNCRNYWNDIVGNKTIQQCMARNVFQQISYIIHFNNNQKMPEKNDPQYDKLFKIRPLMKAILSNFKKVPFQRYISIDEQVCSTKAKNSLRQYNPAKPDKWG
jgi:hypothetical protein